MPKRTSYEAIKSFSWIYIIVAIAIFIYVAYTARANNTLAGSTGWLVIGAIIFILGLCRLTGMSMIPFV